MSGLLSSIDSGHDVQQRPYRHQPGLIVDTGAGVGSPGGRGGRRSREHHSWRAEKSDIHGEETEPEGASHPGLRAAVSDPARPET